MPYRRQWGHAITVVFSFEDYTALDALACERDTTPTGVVRSIVSRYLSLPQRTHGNLAITARPAHRPRTKTPDF